MNRILTVCVLAALLVSMPLPAQLTTGTVQGRVLDSSGAVVPGAELVLTNVETNVATRQTTGAEGTYIFNSVMPGSYNLRASSAGFRPRDVKGITVSVNKNSVIDLTIEPGDVSQSVEVVAAAELIDTQSAAAKTNIESKMMVELPSGSRNPLALAEMAPGVEMGSGGLTGGSQMLGTTGSTLNVSGGRNQHNTFYLDGSDNSGALRNLSLQVPNTEAVEELQVVTSTSSAEFGKQPGGYFNLITKSGTNQLRGSAYYFGQNEVLNANTWGRNMNGLERVPAVRKQWGGTMGGPVKRDKTFFFAAYQRYSDEAHSLNQSVRFPTAKMLAGDFSEYTGVLYHPDTKQPIPGNNLKAAGLIDPVAANLVSRIPTVAKLGDRLVWDFVTPPRSNELLTKIDHNIGSKQRINFSHFGVWGSTAVQGGSLPQFNDGLTTAKQSTLSARHLYTIAPTLIAETQFSRAAHSVNADTDPRYIGKDISDYGAIWPQVIQGGKKYMPNFEIRDSFSSGQVTGGLTDQINWRAGSTMTWIKGTHNVKFGYEAQRTAVANRDEHDATIFRFQGRFSNRGNTPPSSVPYSLMSSSIADFMMGRINDFGISGIVDYEIAAWSHYAFLQDQWRITPKLTLTPGFRYEFYMPASERNGKAAAIVLGHKSDIYPDAPLHYGFQKDKNIQPGFAKPDHNNFAPRIGLAYDPFGKGKLAIRGGYGLYYSYPASQIRVWTTDRFPMKQTARGLETRLSEPWKGSTYSTPPTPFTDDLSAFLKASRPPYTTGVSFNPDFATPMVHQWNVSVEREVRNGVTVTAGYVGSRGKKLLQEIPFNYARYINLPDGTPPSLAAANVLARLSYSDLSQFSIRIDTAGNSWYDAFQLSSTAKLGAFTSRVTYVYADSKGDGGSTGGGGVADEDPSSFTAQTNNPVDPRSEIGPNMRRHTFRYFGVYDIPFFSDKTKLTGKLLGGWQASGQFSIGSGSPRDVILGYDANMDGITNNPQDRPDLAKPISYTNGSKEQKMAGFMDKSSFAKPVISAANLFGNLTRNALWGPGYWSTNAAMMKNFQLRERLRLQVRMEAYNLFNHPGLDGPNTNMASADFTKIITQSGNRTMQYGLKLYF